MEIKEDWQWANTKYAVQWQILFIKIHDKSIISSYTISLSIQRWETNERTIGFVVRHDLLQRGLGSAISNSSALHFFPWKKNVWHLKCRSLPTCKQSTRLKSWSHEDMDVGFENSKGPSNSKSFHCCRENQWRPQPKNLGALVPLSPMDWRPWYDSFSILQTADIHQPTHT